jgi:hypothetical protein
MMLIIVSGDCVSVKKIKYEWIKSSASGFYCSLNTQSAIQKTNIEPHLIQL